MEYIYITFDLLTFQAGACLIGQINLPSFQYHRHWRRATNGERMLYTYFFISDENLHTDESLNKLFVYLLMSGAVLAKFYK